MPARINKPIKVREIGKKAIVGTRKGNKILNKKEIIDALLEVSRKQILMELELFVVSVAAFRSI